LDSTLTLSARREIEAIVLGRPEVSQVSILDQEDPAGERYSIVYATASGARPEPTPAQPSSSQQEGRVGQWKTIFNMTYRPQKEDNGPNFVGWRSSYTNKPIPPEEMREWLDRTVERIESYAPERVLEIGCGVGLLTQRLAPGRKAYTGTDFSGAAIRRLREFTAARSELRHVELCEREATDFAGLTRESFDMAVINSVVQYFPDLAYLETVLTRAADLVVPGGRIFIGDVRHLGLLPAFHAGVQLAKAPSNAKIGWLRSKVSLMIDQERELVIDPEFFRGLSHVIPRISRADILLKRGRARNEMNDYRYDVVLHVGEDSPVAAPEVSLWQAETFEIDEIVSHLEARKLDAVQITGVPNLRVAKDVAAWRLMNSVDAQATATGIRELIDGLDTTGVDPEAFWRLSDHGAYDVLVELPPNSRDGSFDVTVCRRNCRLGRSTKQLAPEARAGGAHKATDPLAAAHKQRLALSLATLLRESLPATQQPAAVLVVDQIPASADALLSAS
jgi:SAM-dependent methyltransferase